MAGLRYAQAGHLAGEGIGMYIYSNVSAGLLYVETAEKTERFTVTGPDGEKAECPLLAVREKDGAYTAVLDASALTPWTPDTPALYDLAAGGETVRFGHTSLRTAGNKAVLLNDRPIYLRGYIRGITAHDHPNMTGGSDYEAALKNVRQAKKYGFNFVRFHSTVPSEDFVRAADELGLLIHMEIGYEYEIDAEGNKRVSTNNAAWRETILRYRNHPSVAVFCIGNEMHNAGHFPEVRALYEEGKALAPTKLILDNTGWGEFDRTSADIFNQHIAYFFPFKHHADMFLTDMPWQMNGTVSDEPLNVSTETENAKADVHRFAVPIRPTLSHESVHYIDVPDYFALTEKYDAFAAKVGEDYLKKHGIKKPRFMTELPALIERKGLLPYMPDYVAGSRKWKCMATKMFLEKCRLSSLCGFEMLQFSDCLKYENKNGIVDCFDDDKGIDPKWMRQFNDDLVLLMDLPEEVYFEDEEVKADVYISDFLRETGVRGDLAVYADGECVYEGKDFALAGGLQKMASLKLRFRKTGAARRVALRAVFSWDGKTAENEWSVWLYPHTRPQGRPEVRIENDPALRQYLLEGTVRADLFATDTFDETVFEKLGEGKTVLLFYEYGAARNAWQMPGALERFKPCIWDRGSNLGGFIESEELCRALAVDRYFDLNLQPVIEAGTKVNLDHFPCDRKEIFCGIDKPARDRMQGLVSGNKSFMDDDTLRRFSHLFSFRVGEGLLIVCTLNVSRPEEAVTSALLTAAVDHPEIFATEKGISGEAFRKWLEETNAAGFKPEDIMNHFWEIDNKPVEDTLFWEEAHIDLADLI